jgi:hypothetical protein
MAAAYWNEAALAAASCILTEGELRRRVREMPQERPSFYERLHEADLLSPALGRRVRVTLTPNTVYTNNNRAADQPAPTAAEVMHNMLTVTHHMLTVSELDRMPDIPEPTPEMLQVIQTLVEARERMEACAQPMPAEAAVTVALRLGAAPGQPHGWLAPPDQELICRVTGRCLYGITFEPRPGDPTEITVSWGPDGRLNVPEGPGITTMFVNGPTPGQIEARAFEFAVEERLAYYDDVERFPSMKNRHRALRKSIELLTSALSDSQLEDFRWTKGFIVRGNRTGRKYRITYADEPFNVWELHHDELAAAFQFDRIAFGPPINQGRQDIELALVSQAVLQPRFITGGWRPKSASRLS